MTVDIHHVTTQAEAPTVTSSPEPERELHPVVAAKLPQRDNAPERITNKRTAKASTSLSIPVDFYFDPAEVDVGAQPLNDVPLRYPWVEYRLKIGGIVRLRLMINEMGGLDKVTVVDATPPGLFEEAALEAVNKLQFSPALKGGRQVKSQKTIEVVFNPSDQFNTPKSM